MSDLLGILCLVVLKQFCQEHCSSHCQFAALEEGSCSSMPHACQLLEKHLGSTLSAAVAAAAATPFCCCLALVSLLEMDIATMHCYGSPAEKLSISKN
jgi:hypothetical protein